MSLKSRLAQQSILVAPGVFDAWSALLAERAGFEAVYLSGASIAYTRLGRPDIGLVSVTEVADTLGCIRERVSLPVIVDADTGFGNALNVRRTVTLLERSGGANGAGGGLAIQIEDQTSPKRCGHLDGKTLIPAVEMAGKIRAALDARASSDTLIVARTDAVAVEGLESALERAERYLEAGADVLFIEALRSPEQMSQATAKFAGRAPLLADLLSPSRRRCLGALLACHLRPSEQHQDAIGGGIERSHHLRHESGQRKEQHQQPKPQLRRQSHEEGLHLRR